MFSRRITRSLLVFLLVSLFNSVVRGQEADKSPKDNQQYQRLIGNLLTQNQLFTENSGQLESDILFQTAGQNAAAAFYADKVEFSLMKDIDMNGSVEDPFKTKASILNWSLKFKNSDVQRVTPSNLVSRNINYFGPNAKSGVTLKEYKELLYSNIYSNTDLKFYENQKGELKYDFIAHPGSDISEIAMEYGGVKELKVLPNGQLQLLTDWGYFIEDAPYSYQEIDGKRVEVPVSYVVEDKTVKFHVNGDYDKTKSLIIDPIYVDWSTYFYGEPTGTTAWGYNWVLDVDIDDEDFVYITGIAGYQRFYSKNGGYDTTLGGNYDVFVCKITPKGDSLEFFTFIGGSNYEYGMNVSVNDKHEVVISGITWGGGFPTTSGAFDEDGKSCTAGSCYQGFISKFDETGKKLIFSTFLTGTKSSNSWWSIDWIRGMQLDNSGKVYLVGSTSSEDFPTTSGCYQDSYGGGTGNTWWRNGDGFLSCLSADGTSLVFSTYIGGNGNDVAKDLYVAGNGDVYVVGETSSTNFKTTPGANVFNRFIKGTSDAFVLKFKPDGKSIYWGKLMGGSGIDYFEGIYATETGDPFIVGATTSSDFYVTSNAFQKSHAGGYDAVVVKMISAGTNVHYSTYLGGGGDDGYAWDSPYFSPLSITANVRDEAIVAATSKSADFPVTTDALQKNNKVVTTGWYYGSLTITKLDYYGNKQLYGTYFGGDRGEFPGGVRAKKVGCVTYILSAGITLSSDYPTTDGVYKDSLRTINGSSWSYTGFVTKFRDTLYTEPIDLGFQDSIVECDNVFEIYDAKNQGADFLWNDGSTNRFRVVNDSGLIWVRATYGCDTVQDSVHITLEHSPKVPVFDNDTTYCDNFPTLQLDAKNDTIKRTYKWSTGSTDQKIWINQPGKYYVDVHTPNCGTKTDTINFKLLDTPKLNLFTDSIACDSVRLSLDAGNENNEVIYRWSTMDSVQTIQVTDSGLYWVTVSNYCGMDSAAMQIGQFATPEVSLPADSIFCNSLDYSLKVGQVDNGETYTWQDKLSGQVVGTQDSINFSSTVYARITIANKCGQALDSIELNLISTPSGMPMDTIYECDVVNEELILQTANAGNLEEYSWTTSSADDQSSVTVTSAGVYTGYITNKCGTDSAQWTVILKHTPSVQLPEDSIYCDNVKASLDVTDEDDEMTYEWQDQSTLPTYAVSQEGLYKVRLTNRCGSDSDEVYFAILATPTVDLGTDQVFCGSVKTTTYNVGLVGNQEDYLWSDGSQSESATFITEGNHWVQIKNKCATVSDTVNFRISEYPVVDLGPDTILCGDFSVPLDAGNPGMTYLWLPTMETTQKINATEQTTYMVTVTNADGCEASSDFKIGTECISFYNIPTAFSPNEDGLNDVFKPTLINYQNYTLSIYNRWGEELFRTEDINEGWDGMVDGKVVPNGVYLYSIRFITTENGQFQNVKGLVNVLR